MKECKVLIVDDLALNRILLSEIMEEAGFTYKMARDGKEAVDKLSVEDFDIVFMDIEMPVMNGFEATRYIKKNFAKPKCDIPVVAVSAHDPVTFWDEYINIGFAELLSKPYSIKKINIIISNILSK